MKRHDVLLALLAGGGLLVLAACGDMGRASAGREVRVGLYQNAPKVYTAEDGQPAGLFVELIDAAARAEGWRLNHVPCEWKACLEQLERGEIDLMPDVAFSAERAERFDFGRVSVANSWSQIYGDPDLAIQTLVDLADRRIAVLRGGIQESFLAQLMAGNHVAYRPLPVASLEEGYQAVVDGKAALRKVVLGKREPGRVEIVSGVTEGETVVLDGQIKLRPGVPVVTPEQAAQMMKKQQAGKPR
jgi:ABC-type amino acid transport substrate-binding protein